MAISLASASTEYGHNTNAGSLPTNAVTMGAWVYFTSLPAPSSYPFCLGLYGDANNGVAFSQGSTAKFRFHTHVAATFKSLITTTAVSTATWYYMVGGRSGANYFFDVFSASGTLVEQLTGTDQTTGDFNWGANVHMDLGIASDHTASHDGRLRNAWTMNSYDTSTAANWARALANNPVLRGPGTFTHFYPLMDLDDARDMVGGNALTMVNTPTTGDDPPTLPKRY